MLAVKSFLLGAMCVSVASATPKKVAKKARCVSIPGSFFFASSHISSSQGGFGSQNDSMDEVDTPATAQFEFGNAKLSR